MRRFGRLPLWTMTAVLLIIAVGGLHSPASADPDFSNVTDFLSGQRHILRADDLVSSDPQADPGTGPFATGWVLFKTQSLDITGTTPHPIGTFPGCNREPSHQTRVGRVWALKNDVVINVGVYCPPGEGQPRLYVKTIDPQSGTSTDQSFSVPSLFAQIVVADVDGDGFDDIVLYSDDALVVYKHADPNAQARGVVEASRLGLGSQYLPYAEPVVGDFNGDGAVDIAWVGLDESSGIWSVHFASVCPAKDAVVLGQICTSALQIIPSTHTISNATPVGGQVEPRTGPTLTGSESGTLHVALTAGDYDGVLDARTFRRTQELVVVQQYLVPTCDAIYHNLKIYSFDAGLQPTFRGDKQFFHSTPQNCFGRGLEDYPLAISARLPGAGQTDQLVFLSRHTQLISVVTFDRDLRMTSHDTKLSDFVSTCGALYGLAAGRFDPPNPPVGLDLSLQVAVLIQASRDSGCYPQGPLETDVSILSVGADFALTRVHNAKFSYPLSYRDGASDWTRINRLAAGDLQGRSLVLGAPSKVTIESFRQPTVILAAPPMHVDFVSPDAEASPIVLNVSAVPAAYFTQYQAEETSRDQSSDQQTTSWS